MRIMNNANMMIAITFNIPLRLYDTNEAKHSTYINTKLVLTTTNIVLRDVGNRFDKNITPININPSA